MVYVVTLHDKSLIEDVGCLYIAFRACIPGQINAIRMRLRPDRRLRRRERDVEVEIEDGLHLLIDCFERSDRRQRIAPLSDEHSYDYALCVPGSHVERPRRHHKATVARVYIEPTLMCHWIACDLKERGLSGVRINHGIAGWQ